MIDLSASSPDDHATVTSATVALGTHRAYEMLAEVESYLESMDASALESKSRSVLLALGFSIASLDKPLAQLSGGWRTRCNLACALCQPSDFLLLDEPTNFLDLHRSSG